MSGHYLKNNECNAPALLDRDLPDTEPTCTGSEIIDGRSVWDAGHNCLNRLVIRHLFLGHPPHNGELCRK